MDKAYKMLIINPGSTSTKISVYENTEPVFEKKLSHSVAEVSAYAKITDQLDFRKQVILSAIGEAGMKLSEFDAIIGRGGLTQPVESGVYEINEKMLNQLKSGEYGEHASNLGAILAYGLAQDDNLPSYIADPVVVDELQDIARLSGVKEIERVSIFHALNQKAVARRAAKSLAKEYKDCNLIVVHCGGGISVAVHKGGKCIDVNNALGGEGPYTPERAGGVPVHSLVDLCFSGKYSKDEIKKLLVGKGGLTSYLGTNDGIEIDSMIKDGNQYAKLIFDGMAYQIGKEIGACASVLHGKVDAVVITGGLAYSKSLVEYITSMVEYIGKVLVFPGEDEMLALAESGLRILTATEEPKIF